MKLAYKKIPLEQLVILAKNSDYKAIEELIRREQKNVFATFSYLTRKREDIADLTQEALFGMARGIAGLKNPKTFKSWLNHIVTNLFYDELRKIHRHPIPVSIDSGQEEAKYFTQIPDTHSKPLEKILASELDKIIKNCIRNLPEHFRIAIILRELQGLTYEEIAIATDTTIGTVKSRIARARERLQSELKPYI